MSHSHGKKRLRYQNVNGHLFAFRKGREISRGMSSLCGLSLSAAQASGAGDDCDPCGKAKAQLWA